MTTTDDRLEIMDLIARYALTSDSMDTNGFVNLFTEDGALNFVAPDNETLVEGREKMLARQTEFYALRRKMREEKGRAARHFQTGTVFLELTENRAITATAFMVSVVEPGKPPFIRGTGEYTDEIVRTPEGWRFKKRRGVWDAAPVS